jgi:Ca-activated chloride channel homolog
VSFSEGIETLVGRRKRLPHLILVFLWLTGLPGGARAQTPEEFRISVNVDLVVLHPTVRDGKGQFASDLRERDFEVYEDGARQATKIFLHEDVPVTVGLVIDHSSSMRHKLTDVVAAARTFVNASRADDQMFVVNFNEKVTLGLPGSRMFSSNAGELEGAIFSMRAEGMTALYDAVAAGQERLRSGVWDKKVLIVISDGGDNASTHNMAGVLKAAERSSALVYTIGISDPDDPDRNPDALRRLARATGGDAFFPSQLGEVVAICDGIARDIRHQYTIGYVSSNIGRSGAYRAIRVVARSEGKKLIVRTRSGYVAGGDARPGEAHPGEAHPAR